jgi:FADH2 O2-dependent halogenase
MHMPRIGYRTTSMTGERWALLPSAAGVIDPLLSTGFPLTLLGIPRLLEILDRATGGHEVSDELARYEAITQLELDATERLVGALYTVMDDPEAFKRLTLLYFAAASFSETVRRLERPQLARGFLLSSDPGFGPELAACADLAAQRPQGPARRQLFDRIDRAIEPFDVAGLGDHSRRSWYPVRAADLIAAAGRLGASRARVEQLLERSGFLPVAAAPSTKGTSATSTAP